MRSPAEQPTLSSASASDAWNLHRHAGDSLQATRLYGQAIEPASVDPYTLINATINLSELSDFEGDHQSSLDQLRTIQPIVEIISRVSPFYAGLYANEVAYELAQLGRLDEARRFAAYALASPFARAWPEWRDTAHEIEQQAEAKAALHVRPALQQARKTSLKSKLRLVKKPCSLASPASTRRRIGPVATIRPEQPRSRPILEQICLKVRIRAPSF